MISKMHEPGKNHRRGQLMRSYSGEACGLCLKYNTMVWEKWDMIIVIPLHNFINDKDVFG